MQEEKRGIETGRTMVEMLAVLGLVGVLSIGGIVGYSYAMRLYQEAETLDQLSVTISGGRTWDIPLHFGPRTVGLADNYVPYVVPIRDVVSRVNYRKETSAYEEGLTDDEGALLSGVTMNEVREYESFTTLLDAPAWVRAEDEMNWSVRVTGLSYSLCEKLLRKSDLGFDYAYVALQNAQDQSPMDPSFGDFTMVDASDKYANPIKEDIEGIKTAAQIEKVCSILDKTKGSLSLAQNYIRNLDNPEKATVKSGTEATVCQDKKSLACLAYGARVYNEETKKVDLPLQTLVLYFGKNEDIIPAPPPVDYDCLEGTPYSVESGGKIESANCCLALENTYFIPGIPKCCQVVENIENEPRCELTSSGLYAIDILVKRDATGKPILDSSGNYVYYERKRLQDASIQGEETIYLGGDWTGRANEQCCSAKKETSNMPTTDCHYSSINSLVTPWVLIESQGTTASQYQNCPHGVASQASNITSSTCCTASGEYWSEQIGLLPGTVDTSSSGQALCCSKNNVMTYRAVSNLDQCPWEHVSNIPATAIPAAGATPIDILGNATTDCCYKTIGANKKLISSACAYEGGVLKYSSSCCNISTDSHGRKLAYVYAPNYNVAGAVSSECGVVAGGGGGTPEPDRNCCVDYRDMEANLGGGQTLTSNQVVQDWMGKSAPEYCCETLIGTSLAATETDMKKNYKYCCESELYFVTSNTHIKSAGTFVPAGTLIEKYSVLQACPAGLIGTLCSKTGLAYQTTENQCCDLAKGIASDGTENKVCCEYGAMLGLHSNYWNGTACVPCGTNCIGYNSYDPDPDPDKCYDICHYFEEVEPEEIEPTVKSECDTKKGCFMEGTTCCQAEGVLASGKISCACCPDNPSGLKFGDDCFLANGARALPPVDCYTEEVVPGSMVPGYTIEKTKILRTYVCPEGVTQGTKTDVGLCPGEELPEG